MAEDDFQSTVDHFEDILDKEDAPPPKEKPQRAQRAKPEPEDDDDTDLPVADDEEPVDDEDGEADDRPAKDEDEPDEEEEEPEETALDLNQIVRVNVDGEPAEVSLQEALNGYIRVGNVPPPS